MCVQPTAAAELEGFGDAIDRTAAAESDKVSLLLLVES
jgi:hypothetical protein